MFYGSSPAFNGVAVLFSGLAFYVLNPSVEEVHQGVTTTKEFVTNGAALIILI
jgi:hypothetical protein